MARWTMDGSESEQAAGCCLGVGAWELRRRRRAGWLGQEQELESWSYSSGTRYASAVISVSHSPGNSDCTKENEQHTRLVLAVLDLQDYYTCTDTTIMSAYNIHLYHY